MNYCIKGNKTRGNEVIALLESKGGKNLVLPNYSGIDEDAYYYIGNDNVIRLSRDYDTIHNLCKELSLPEEVDIMHKFKIGDYVRTIHGIAVIVEFSKFNTSKQYNIQYISGRYIWESEDNLEKWIPRRGESVLVRNDERSHWREAVFSYIEDSINIYPYIVVGGIAWNKCIPFNIEKLGKLTND